MAGLREKMKSEGINIPDHLWELVLKKKPIPPSSPVQWDWGAVTWPRPGPTSWHNTSGC